MVNSVASRNKGRGIDIASRVKEKYHFPRDLKGLERAIRMSLGLPVKGRMGGIKPYGYEYNEQTDTYDPLPEIFALLWKAREHLKFSSLREVADWLNYHADKLGSSDRISHMGLKNVMLLRPPFEECLLPLQEREKLVEAICQMNMISKEH